VKPATLICLAACGAIFLSATAGAFPLPAVCSGAHAGDPTTPISALRRQVEAESETNPTAAVSLMCTTIPRVAHQYGEQSPELAWWVESLTMPMIAYMDRFAEALPLLAFAQPILERTYGAEAEPLADIHVAYAWIFQRQGKLTDATREWQRALAIRERFPGPQKVELQKALVGVALTALDLGALRDAESAIRRARDILIEYHEEVSEAAAAIENTYTNIAFREEHFRDAKQHAENQIAIERQLRAGIGQLVPAYVFLGQVLERLNDFPGAEAALREAIGLAESGHGGPLQRHRLTALTHLATLLNARGRPREALEFARRAVDLGTSTLGPTAPHLVQPLQSLADTYRALGALPESWHLYERIATIVAANPADVERPVLVAYYRGLAGLQLDLGNPDDAVSALHAGLEAASAEPALALPRAYLLATLAQVTARTNVAGAQDQFTQARRLFASKLPSAHPALLRVINDSCALEIETRARPRSCEEAARRLAAASDVEPELRAAVYDNSSALDQTRGNLQAAVRAAESGIAAAEGLGTPQPLWKAYFRAASVLRARGQPQLAIFFGKRALMQIERQREQFTGEDERFDHGFLVDKTVVYRSVADWLLESARVDEAIDVMHLLKAQEFAEFASRAAAAPLQGPGPQLTDAEQTLAGRYSSALPGTATVGGEIDRLSRLQDDGRITPGEQATLDALARNERQRESDTANRIHRFVERNGGAPTGPILARTIKAARLQQDVASSPADSIVAYYLLTPARLQLLIATRTSQRQISIPVDGPALQRTIGQFLEQITQRADASATARTLYRTVAAPLDDLARREKITHLVLWLDGPMRYVPFGALLADDGYLANRYAIEILPQADPPQVRAAAGAAAPLIVRGFGVTQAVAGFPPLPAMADELCYVVRGPIAGLAASSAACSPPAGRRGALVGEGFANAQFTAARLESQLRPPHAFTVLHLGTHFSLRPGNINRSFLVLGDGTRLTLDALSALDFSGLDLVTLSACQTAVGGARTDDGREVEGLSALVQQRGAKRVIASLWQVEDVSTAELMHALYERLENPTADIAAALEEAQRSLRERTVGGRQPYASPYYWAGFIVSGR